MTSHISILRIGTMNSGQQRFTVNCCSRHHSSDAVLRRLPDAKTSAAAADHFLLIPYANFEFLARALQSNVTEQTMPGLDLADSKEDSLVALNFILEAWEEGAGRGIAPELMAYAALYTALTDLVAAYGETRFQFWSKGSNRA